MFYLELKTYFTKCFIDFIIYTLYVKCCRQISCGKLCQSYCFATQKVSNQFLVNRNKEL